MVAGGEMKNLFAQSPEFLRTVNATVGASFIRDYSYAVAYWSAGDILVKDALESDKDKRDGLFYPICFMYRHFIELTLKQLIIHAEAFYEKTEIIGYELQKYTKPKKELESIHSLEILVKRLIDVLTCISEGHFDDEIKKIILEFHAIDPVGQTFRYPTNRKHEKSFSQVQNFNIATIKTGINKVAQYFMGIDTYLGHYTTLADGIISEQNPQ